MVIDIYASNLFLYLARFIQPDTLTEGGPQGLNRYEYVNNNPINATDPTGHMITECGPQGEDYGGGGENLSPTDPCTIDPGLPRCGPLPSTPNNNGDNEGTNNKVSITKIFLSLPLNDQIWDYFAIGLDLFAWLLDTYSIAVVTYGGIAGAGIGLPFAEGGPEVPAATGWLGISIAELSVQGTIRTASFLALVSTAATFVADTKAGNTVIEQGKLGSATVNSLAFSVVGFFDPEAYTSWLLQSSSVANDFGWISFPLFKSRSQA